MPSTDRARIAQQYNIGYTPSNSTADGGYRKLEIKTKPDFEDFQARKGYYAVQQ